MSHVSSAPSAGRRPLPVSGLLTELLTNLAHAYRVPGAQLAVHVDSVTHSAYTGHVNVATGEPFTAETAVPIGSVTKTYTATALMILVAEGDLGLDDPVADHVPELRRAPRFTVRQLLGHTAGLPTGPDSDEAAALSTARYLSAHCAAGDAVGTPGAGFSYSNAGYVAAGRAVEAVTGMSWEQAVRAMVVEPLGAIPAFVGDRSPRRPVAGGHSVHPSTGRALPVRQTLAPVEAPAGAVLASALDLLALGRAVAGHGPASVLASDAAEEMRRPVAGADPGVLADGWGAGLALFGEGTALWCGHDGNAQGTSCHLRVEPELGAVVAFTSNGGNGTELWHALADGLADLTGLRVPTAARVPERGGPVVLPQCAGTYRNGALEYRVTADAEGALALSVGGDTPAPLVCYPDFSCDLVDPASGRRLPGGRFLRDARSGAVDRVQISGRTARRTDDV
ncbi:serine hydrolase domain-containing protein [Streptomyces sp. NPDC057702]|uniref:serine hydrolase domain-containing protein n=1 Tax=unclassified Streptomyces TaxID=2593676 RepID=UPI0036A2A316